MFQFTRRTARSRTNPLSNSKASLLNNRKPCPVQCSPTAIIILIAMSLVLFSLYLSTIIPNRQYAAYNPNNPSLNFFETPLSEQSSNNRHNVIITESANDWRTAVQKSMNLYLNRPGHNDRVEYLIGFKGTRITDHATQYQTLQIRNTEKYDRDYRETPIAIKDWTEQPSSETKCDALCVPCASNCDVSGIHWSMENVQVGERSNQITGSTQLSSLVPVPYFSWHDFQFMLPMKPKTGDAMAAAFISNCAFRKRNKMVRDLQAYGVTVDSYGGCEHNRDEPLTPQGKRGNKIDILQQYKFSLAFENSETDDYITEKFFGSLQSGSVPVYMGASNVKFFAPDFGINGAAKPWQSSAVIWAGDYDFDAQKLAQYLLYLDSNETAYNEYLRWKKEGYSGDFKAMVELTAATHTNCRQCILATDWQRYKHGIGRYDEVMHMNVFPAGSDVKDGKRFYVRERGMYRFTLVQMELNTLQSLLKSVLIAIKPKPVNLWKNNQHPNYSKIGPALYAIYHLPTKHVVHSDVAIQNLPNYAELEVIFV